MRSPTRGRSGPKANRDGRPLRLARPRDDYGAQAAIGWPRCKAGFPPGTGRHAEVTSGRSTAPGVATGRESDAPGNRADRAEEGRAMRQLRVGVDIGGTFTDIVFLDAGGQIHTKKVSSSVDNYARAIVDGL